MVRQGSETRRFVALRCNGRQRTIVQRHAPSAAAPSAGARHRRIWSG
jgi:hypothetical protein